MKTTPTLLTALVVLVCRPVPGHAQATLRGKVVDSELGTGLGGAVVEIQHAPQSFTTDSQGRFEAPNLASGVTRVTIKVIGYVGTTFTVSIPATGTVEGTFPLDFTGYKLTEIAV